MQQLDAKMEDFKEEVKHKLIDTPASYEEQSKLIKYLKVCAFVPVNDNYHIFFRFSNLNPILPGNVYAHIIVG